MPLFSSVLKSLARFAFGAAPLVAACAATPAQADPTWNFKGFGTLGILGADQPGFRRDITQHANVATPNLGMGVDSRLGLQLDLDFHNPFHVTVQWIARDHVGNFIEQNLEWAFLRWRLRDDLDLRVGRVGTTDFMLSDYRNVGYAYPWIRPPHEFYGIVVPYHMDGGDIVWKRALGNGYLSLKGYAGYSFAQTQPSTSTVDREYLLAGANLSYESGDWRARIGYTWINSTNNDPLPLQNLYAALRSPAVNAAWPGASGLAGGLSIRDKPLHYSSLGLAYDDGTWLAQAEAAYIDSNFLELPNLGNGYLSLGRRFHSVTLYTLLGISQALDTANIPAAPASLAALRGQVVGLTNRVDEKSASLGARWDVCENIALKAQWSHFWLEDRTNPASPIPHEANVWSLGMDFVF